MLILNQHPGIVKVKTPCTSESCEYFEYCHFLGFVTFQYFEASESFKFCSVFGSCLLPFSTILKKEEEEQQKEEEMEDVLVVEEDIMVENG